MDAKQLPHPFNFYRLMLEGDAMHFGYWLATQPDLTLEQAQDALTAFLLARFPAPPAKVLDVGCGLGATSGRLATQGYAVTALAPPPELIAYAKQHHPGPVYLACGLLDEVPELAPNQHYDVILLQESLQYLPDLNAVFTKLKSLLNPTGGRLIICDEVSYSPDTQTNSAVHQAVKIEQAFAAQGFYVAFHQHIGANVLPTCSESVARFTERRAELVANCGTDAHNLLTHYTDDWRYREQMYRTGKMGYEVWELRPSDICVRGYEVGDEARILSTFNQVFGVSRSMAHWQWKYRDNVFARTAISAVWHQDRLAAHYSGYDLPFCAQTANECIQHVGDIFSVEAYRRVGRGSTSLLARAFRYHEWMYFKQQIKFAFGFLTGVHKRFGELILGYTADTPIYDWVLRDFSRLPNYNTWRRRGSGYHLTVSEQVSALFDTVFADARPDYPWLIERTQTYLRWRYEYNPDDNYTFFLVQRWGKPLGWWLVRRRDHALHIGDALFIRRTAANAAKLGLAGILHYFHQQGHEITEIRGWFAEVPAWWPETLTNLGFTKQRQGQDLCLCVKSYTEGLTPQDIAENFYFTWGDGDLF